MAPLIQFHMSTQLDICNISVSISDETLIGIMNVIRRSDTYVVMPVQFFMVNKNLVRSLYRILHKMFGAAEFHGYYESGIVTLKLNKLPQLCSISRLNLFNFDDVASLIPALNTPGLLCAASIHVYDYELNLILIKYTDKIVSYTIFTHEYELKVEYRITEYDDRCFIRYLTCRCCGMDPNRIFIRCLYGRCICNACKCGLQKYNADVR